MKEIDFTLLFDGNRIQLFKWMVLSVLVWGYSTNILAQTIVQGHIKDAKGKNVPDASVTLNNPLNGSIVAYGFSNEVGNYKLSIDTNIDSLSISVAGFNVAAKTKQIKNQSQIVNFVADTKEIELKEVIVKSTKIWGKKDTINYLVSAFSDKKDFVIGDVLKKMPGIDVGKDGSISYQGKPINKFYIENMDMLQGRYGIATNNISAKDVATVQILENHQSIKALEKTNPSNDAAINLKLKDEAKGTLSIMAKLGLGASPLLWENELAGMYFAKKRQNITTYKGNNSGVNLSNELRSFYGQTNFGAENILNVQMPSSPGIDQKRYLFNNSNAVTVNNLFKSKENSQLNLNLIYLNDHENRKSNEYSSYYLPGERKIVIDEGLASAKNTDRLETEIRYNLNETNNYINNFLNISGLWENSMGDVSSTMNVHQALRQPSFSVSNDFNWVKKTSDEKGFKVYSTLGFKTTPQKLMIYPGLYPDIFNDGNDYSMLKQDSRINSCYSNNTFTLLSPIMFGKFRIDSDLGLNLEYRNLHSSVYTKNGDNQALLASSDSMKNNLDWMKYSAYTSATLKYYVEALKIDVSFPINYNIIQLNNKITSDKENICKLYFQPSLSISYEVNTKLKLTGGYSFYNQTGNMMSLYTGYILSDYRSLNRYDGQLSESSGNGGSISLSYKDLVNMFFFSSGLNYNYSKSNILYGQNFQGILSVISSIEQEHSQNGVSVNSHISKGFDWKNIVTTLNASYGTSSAEQLRQNTLIDCRSKGLNLTGSLDCKPVSYVVFAYKGVWGKSWTKIESGENASSFNSFVNNLSLDISLPKNLSINLGYEHYYNSASLGSKRLSFTDLGMSYVWKKMHYSLSWNNIFNTDNYTSSYYDAINTFQRIYHIRPSNIMLKVMLKLK